MRAASKISSDTLTNFTAPQPARAENSVETPTVSPALTLDVSVQCFKSGITGPGSTGDLPFPALLRARDHAGAWFGRCLVCRTTEYLPKEKEVFQAQAKIFEWRNGK
jgi:hypothetical protein